MARSSLRFLLPVLVLLAIAAAIAWRLSEAPPSWYRPPDPTDPQVVQLADDVEYRLVEEAHRPRPSDESFTVRLREEHANAWLSARLPKWLRGRSLEWPTGLNAPQVRMTPRGIEVASEVHMQGGKRFVVALLAPRIEEDQLVVTVDRVSLGRISMRGTDSAMLLGVFASEAELQSSEFGSMLADATGAGAVFEPMAELADGRLVRIEAIQFSAGHMDVTMKPHDPSGIERTYRGTAGNAD